MTQVSLHYFIEDSHVAKRVAVELGILSFPIKLHQFPDGESKLQIEPCAGTAIVYASLNDPDRKLIQLAFAASALKSNGAQRIILVAPYLCYMRQDMAFQAGEAVSQRVIGLYLDAWFDRLITVDPHLHRIQKLQEIFTNCRTDVLSATGPISKTLEGEIDKDKTILIGPDSESEQWVSAIAEKIQIPYITGNKIRRGDRSVSIDFSEGADISNKHAVIVDDVISSGMTIAICCESLLKAGVTSIEVMATHILCNDENLNMIMASGVSRVRSTDSVQHKTNAIRLTSLLAGALNEEC